MITIFKYKLELLDEQEIRIPSMSKILSVQIQEHDPCIWAIVDTDSKLEKRKFAIIGTGNPCWCSAWDFIGTVQERRFVWHVFVEPKA